jgi:hypothetical protein
VERPEESWGLSQVDEYIKNQGGKKDDNNKISWNIRVALNLFGLQLIPMGKCII